MLVLAPPPSAPLPRIYGGAQLLLADCRGQAALQRRLSRRGTCLKSAARVQHECECHTPKLSTRKAVVHR